MSENPHGKGRFQLNTIAAWSAAVHARLCVLSEIGLKEIAIDECGKSAADKIINAGDKPVKPITITACMTVDDTMSFMAIDFCERNVKSRAITEQVNLCVFQAFMSNIWEERF